MACNEGLKGGGQAAPEMIGVNPTSQLGGV